MTEISWNPGGELEPSDRSFLNEIEILDRLSAVRSTFMQGMFSADLSLEQAIRATLDALKFDQKIVSWASYTVCRGTVRFLIKYTPVRCVAWECEGGWD